MINIRGDEAAVRAYGWVCSQLCLLFLSVGDIAIDLRAVEGGYPRTDFIMRAYEEIELDEGTMEGSET